MEKEFYYIKETSNKYKIRIFLTGLIVLMVFAGAIIAFVGTFNKLVLTFPGLELVKSITINEIKSSTSIGLFYTGLFGGLFFIPIPQEIFYYYGLLQNNSIILSLITVNAGFLLAQGINYFIGARLNNFFFQLTSKKRVYKVRRFINKHGAKGVFLFNLLPLPAPLLTFALGIAKYNIYRLFFYILLGTILKYGVIILFFLATK